MLSIDFASRLSLFMGTCAAPGRRFRRVFSINSSVFQRNRRKSRVENLNEQIACEQALLFGQAKRVSRERVSERPRKGELATISHKFSFPPRKPRDSTKRENCHRKRSLRCKLSYLGEQSEPRVLARLVSLAQIGELARRLFAHLNFQLQNLNFTSEFNILHSSFRVHVFGKRFYTCLLAFELNCLI